MTTTQTTWVLDSPDADPNPANRKEGCLRVVFMLLPDDEVDISVYRWTSVGWSTRMTRYLEMTTEQARGYWNHLKSLGYEISKTPS
jgi:Tfp pilus assembly protein PilV